MRFSKKLSYKLAKPLTTLALVVASFGCHKDNGEDPIPTHETTYKFGARPTDWDAFIDNVKRSADSASVERVIVYCIPEQQFGGGVSTSEFREFCCERVLDAVSPKNRHKVIGGGNARYLGMHPTRPEYAQEQADSAWINDVFKIKVDPVNYIYPTQKQ